MIHFSTFHNNTTNNKNPTIAFKISFLISMCASLKDLYEVISLHYYQHCEFVSQEALTAPRHSEISYGAYLYYKCLKKAYTL